VEGIFSGGRHHRYYSCHRPTTLASHCFPPFMSPTGSACIVGATPGCRALRGPSHRMTGRKAGACQYTRKRSNSPHSPHGGHGESLMPLYTCGSVSFSQGGLGRKPGPSFYMWARPCLSLVSDSSLIVHLHMRRPYSHLPERSIRHRHPTASPCLPLPANASPLCNAPRCQVAPHRQCAQHWAVPVGWVVTRFAHRTSAHASPLPPNTPTPLEHDMSLPSPYIFRRFAQAYRSPAVPYSLEFLEYYMSLQSPNIFHYVKFARVCVGVALAQVGPDR
jgi:hypothetical protein